MTLRYLLCLTLTYLLLFSSHLSADQDKSSEAFPDIIKSEEGYYYLVKKGDTLWDISAKFFNTPWYWPGLWAENNVSIDSNNPHWIYPGQKLRLALRDIQEFFPEEEKTEVKPQSPQPPPVAPSFNYSAMNKVGFITPEPVVPSAHLISATEAKEMISAGDRIYVKAAEDRVLPIAGRYIVHAEPELVKDPDKKRKNAGFLHYISGIVEINEHRANLSVANVIHAFRPMQAGDALSPMPQTSTKIPLKEDTRGIEGKIIAGDLGQVMFAQGDVIYINLGRKDGISPGQSYFLIEEKEIMISTKQKETDRIPFGAIFILDTREKASAALMIDSRKDATIGSIVASPL